MQNHSLRLDILLRASSQDVRNVGQLARSLRPPQFHPMAFSSCRFMESQEQNGDRYTSFGKQGTSEKIWSLPHNDNTMRSFSF